MSEAMDNYLDRLREQRRETEAARQEKLENADPGFLATMFANLASGYGNMGASLLKGVGAQINALDETGRESSVVDSIRNGTSNTLLGDLGKWMIDTGDEWQRGSQNVQSAFGTRKKYADLDLTDRVTTPEYWTDPRGAWADVMQGTGSSIPFLALSAIAPEVTIGSRAIGALSNAPGLLGRGFSALGSKGAGAAADKMLSIGATTAPLDAFTNASEIYDELKAQGLSDTEAAAKIREAALEELPYDFLNSAIFGGVVSGRLGRALAGGANANLGRRIAGGLGTIPIEMGSEYAQESMQQRMTNEYTGKPTGTWYNPSPEEAAAGAAGAIGALLPAIGGAAHTAYTGGEDEIPNPFTGNRNGRVNRGNASATESVTSTSDLTADEISTILSGSQQGTGTPNVSGAQGRPSQQQPPIQPQLPPGGGLDDAAGEFLGKRMDNGQNGCVEAVTKIGAKTNSFLAEQLSKGVVYVPTLVENAGDRVIPFNASQLEKGDVIVYGDNDHVVLYDGNGGYYGNSSSQEKVVHGDDYTAMDNLAPTKIIKTGGQSSGETTQAAAQQRDGDSNAWAIYDVFRNAGYNDNAIAGILGRVQQEHNFDTSNVEEYDDAETGMHLGGYGMFQWNGGRTDAFLKWTQENNLNPQDASVQAQYALMEAQERGLTPDRMNNLSVEDAADVWTDEWEVGEHGNEHQYAVEWASRIQNGGGTGNAIVSAGAAAPAAQENQEDLMKMFQSLNGRELTRENIGKILSMAQEQMETAQGLSPEQEADYVNFMQQAIQNQDIASIARVHPRQVLQILTGNRSRETKQEQKALPAPKIETQTKNLNAAKQRQENPKQKSWDGYLESVASQWGIDSNRFKQERQNIREAHFAQLATDEASTGHIPHLNRQINQSPETAVSNMATAGGYYGKNGWERGKFASMLEQALQNPATAERAAAIIHQMQAEDEQAYFNQDVHISQGVGSNRKPVLVRQKNTGLTSEAQQKYRAADWQNMASREGYQSSGQAAPHTAQATGNVASQATNEGRDTSAQNQTDDYHGYLNGKTKAQIRNIRASLEKKGNAFGDAAGMTTVKQTMERWAETDSENKSKQKGNAYYVHDNKVSKGAYEYYNHMLNMKPQETGTKTSSNEGGEKSTPKQESTMARNHIAENERESYQNAYDRIQKAREDYRSGKMPAAKARDEINSAYRQYISGTFVMDARHHDTLRSMMDGFEREDVERATNGNVAPETTSQNGADEEKDEIQRETPSEKGKTSQTESQKAREANEENYGENEGKTAENKADTVKKSKLQRIRRGREEMQAVAKKYADGEISQAEAYKQVAAIAKDTATVPKEGTPNVTYMDGGIKQELNNYGNSLIDEAKAPEEKATTQQKNQEEDSIFGSIEDADREMFEALGITPEDAENEELSFTNEFGDTTDEEIEALKKELSQELSKLSANPVFNPRVYSLGLQLGGKYIQKGYRTFKKWIEKMRGDFGEQIEPWAPAIWETLSTYPKGQKFDPKKVMAVSRAIGARYERGDKDLASISDRITERMSKENKKTFAPLIEASYNGIKKFFDEREAAQNGEETRRNVEAGQGKGESSSSGHSNMESGEVPGANEERGGSSAEGTAATPEGEQGTRTRNETGDTSTDGRGRDTGRSGRKRVGGKDDSTGDGTGSNQQSVLENNPSKDGDKPAEVPGHNFHITKASGIGEGGEKTKFKQNIDAITLLKKLEAEGRRATPEEQAILAKFNGWGTVKSAFTNSKEWEKEYAQLKELLTPEEYKEAASASLNAFYTPLEVVNAIWKGMERVGFKGGRVLDPSMGTGNFFGMMSLDMANASTLHGVEKDSLTGRLAKQLYQKADVQVAGFEETSLPNNFFDLAISNVPFGETTLFDRAYEKTSTGENVRYRIHNYFFAKAMDKVRPGGFVAFITGPGTMQTTSKEANLLRLEMARKADLVAAFKLPGSTFEKNAGTSVTTDILILQKRVNPKKAADYAQKWDEVGTIDVAVQGQGWPTRFNLNQYYVEHPNNMIGTPVADKLYGQRDRMGLDGKGLDVGKELSKRMGKLPKDIYAPVKVKTHSTVESTKKFLSDPGTLEHSYVVKDGKPYQNIGGELNEVPAKSAKAVTDFCRLRSALNAVLKAQIDPAASDATIDKLRKDLNQAYDSFVKKHGYVNAKKNVSALGDDPMYGQVAAVEKYEYDKDTKTEKASKTDIFTKRTVGAIREISSADSPTDALTASIAQMGKVDIPYMANLLGKSEKETIQALGDLVYENPSTGQQELAEEYLSGNVRAKLAEAETAAKTNPAYKRNVEALKKVQPVDYTEHDIKANIGAPWIPAEVYQGFTRHMVGAALEIKHEKLTNTWKVGTNWSADRTKMFNTWGTSLMPFNELLERILGMKEIQVKEKDKDGNTIVNTEATAAAVAKAEEVQAEFEKWLWSEEGRKTELLKSYNKLFNSEVERNYDGSALTFPGLVSHIRKKLYPHQKNAIWRMMQGGNTLIAHCVGAGKTWEMQIAGMEMKRVGICRKPMYVVPNNIVEQFRKEFYETYPNAKLLVLTAKDLPGAKLGGGADTFTEKLDTTKHKETKGGKAQKKEKEEAGKRQERLNKRRAALSRIATEDWDGIIISHNLFTNLPMSPESYNEFYREQLDELDAAIRQMKSDEFGKMDKRSVTALENAKENLENRLKRDVSEDKKEVVIPFEELGIDQIFVDEADKFKNLAFHTSMGRLSGISTSNAKRSTDMYVKTRYMTKTYGRGIVFATGTPISNSMNEMYTMQRYLDADKLKDLGMNHFDSWAAMFGKKKDESEPSPDGNGFRMVTKLKFTNLQVLGKIYRSFADIKLPEDLPYLKRPKLKNGSRTVISVESTEAFDDLKQTLVERTDAIRSGHPMTREKKDGSTYEDNMLAVTNDFRTASLDMRLINPTLSAEEAGAKIAAICDTVKRKYDETTPVSGAQVIFADIGTPKAQKDTGAADDENVTVEETAENITVYDEIKKGLIRRGIPANEIGFVHDGKNPEQRQALFEKVNEGKLRVFIGSTETMGAGTNFQHHLAALHHLDCPWKPRDVEQREGRILRAGNENPEVEIFTYVTKGSYDANMWDKVRYKQQMIDSVMRGDPAAEEMDDISSNSSAEYGDIEAIAMDNPLMAEKVNLDAEVMRLKSLESSYNKEQRRMRGELQKLPAQIEQAKADAGRASADIKDRVSTKGDDFQMKIGEKVYTKRADATKALEAIDKTFRKTTSTKIGEIGGFEIHMRYEQAYVENLGGGQVVHGRNVVQLVNHGSYTAEPSVSSMEYTLSHAPDKALRSAEMDLKKSEERQKGLEEEIKKPFKQEEQLEEAVKRQKELQKLLDEAKKPQETQENQPAKKETVSNESTEEPKQSANNFIREHVLVGTIPKTDTKQRKSGETMNFTGGEFKHTKTGEMIPQAKIKDKVSADTYKKLNTMAKNYGGYYSRVSKSFLFKEVSKRDEFLNAAEALLASTDSETMAKLSITAWHGSPHKFDSFSLQSIGTGEGAQVHGWGLYFAGAREVSEGYREKLTEHGKFGHILIEAGNKTYTQHGSIFTDGTGKRADGAIGEALGVLARTYKDGKANTDEAIQQLEQRQQDLHERAKKSPALADDFLEAAEEVKDAIKLLRDEGSSWNIKSEIEGSLFQVEIPDEDFMLDEQKLFDRQSEEVKKSLDKIIKDLPIEKKFLLIDGKSHREEALYRKYKAIQSEVGRLNEAVNNPEEAYNILYKHWGIAEYAEKLTANKDRLIAERDKYQQLANKLKSEISKELSEVKISASDVFKHMSGREIYETISKWYHPDSHNGSPKASELLNKHGVKGITYVGGTDGRCYVVFDDQAIDIIGKFSANDEIRKILDGIKIVDNTELNSQQRKLSEMGESMGAQVVWIDADSRLNGFHSNNVTFLNRKAGMSIQKTFWHEQFHWIRNNNDELWQELLTYFKGKTAFTKKQIDAYRDKYGRYDVQTDEGIIEEMLADAFMDVQKRVPIMQEMAKENPSLAKRFVAWLKQMMDRFIEVFHNPEGKLTTAQRDQFVQAFGKLAGSMVDDKGRKLFKVYNRGKRITYADGMELSPIQLSSQKKISLDNSDNSEYNDSRKYSLKMSDEGLTKIHKDWVTNKMETRPNGERVFHLLYKPSENETPEVRYRRRMLEAERIGAEYDNGVSDDPFINFIGESGITDIENRFANGEALREILEDLRAKLNDVVKTDGIRNEKTVILRIRALMGGIKYARRYANTGRNAQAARRAIQRGEGNAARRNGNDDRRNPANERNGIKFESRPEEGGFSSGDNRKYSVNLGESENNFLDRLTERFGKSAGVKAGKIIVEERGKSKNDIGLVDYIAASPSRIAGKVKMFRQFFQMGDKAMNVLTKNRSDFARKLEQAMDFVESKEEREDLFNLLLIGDAEAKEYTRDELINDEGVSEDVAEAYIRIRRLMTKAYNMVNDAKRRPQMHTRRMTDKQINNLQDNKFVEIKSVHDAEDGKKLVSYKEYANWEKSYTVDAETLARFQQDDAMQVLGWEENADGSYTVDVRESVPPVNKLTGYIPHFFHDYMIRVKDGEGNYVATIGSGRTEREAIKKADEWLKNNQLEDGQQVYIAPKAFSFDSLGMDESQYAAVMGDTDFDQMMNSIAEKNDMTLEEAKEMMKGSVKKKNRHRFFGNLMHRKGVAGYEKDLNWVLRHYFNSASRYAAMETEFKPKAISLFERYFGDFSKDHTGLAQYTKDYINDINGNPSALEEAINRTLNKSDLWNRFAVSNFGDRAALQFANTVTNWTSMLCLGYLNASSAILNFTQAINATGYLGSVAAGGDIFKYGFKRKYSLKELKVLLETNVMNDIGLDAGSGYDTNRGYAGAALGALGKISNKGMILFKLSEGAMRRGTVLAAYNKAVRDGKSHADAIAYAKEVNRKSNFDYGVADAPNIFRRGSIFSQLALQFKKYAFKELEVMGDFLPMLSKNTDRKQKMLFWGMYFLACGLLQVPAVDWLDKLLGENMKDFIQKSIMEATGDSAAGKLLAKTAMYGLPAVGGIDISNRAGMADVVPTKPTDIFGPALNKTASLVSDLAKGGGAAAIRDVSPGIYNQYTAWIAGQSTGSRGRINNQYDSIYSKMLKSVGFKSTDERIASDIQRITYNEKSRLTKEKQAAVDAYLADPTTENAKKLRELGVKPDTVKKERERKSTDRLGRVKAGMSKDEQARFNNLLKFTE